MIKPTYRLLTGDVTECLRTLSDNSVHTCVTSPPYWFLRDYGTSKWEGGDPNCEHTVTGRPDQLRATKVNVPLDVNNIDNCYRCGAKRIDKQIGLEPNYKDYITNLTNVFHELRRVLRKDGTLWLNLGDTYMSENKGSGGPSSLQDSNVGSRFTPRKVESDLKNKDLVGIPWSIVFSLRDDGWWLRSDIIWAKESYMPNSMDDRPTTAHEYIFLLSNDEKYYYDKWAIMEKGKSKEFGYRNKSTIWKVVSSNSKEEHYASFSTELVKPCILAGTSDYGVCSVCGNQYVREVEKTQLYFRTLGWKATCECNAEIVPATVIDIFSGTGTTGDCALRNGRNYIGIDLSEKYNEIAERRLKAIASQSMMSLI